jgi:hypothetical protein
MGEDSDPVLPWEWKDPTGIKVTDSRNAGAKLQEQ